MSFIEIEKPRPHVTLVTLNRPERMNAMAFDVMIPLRDALRDISTDNECRVVVLTGAGHGFCSGADLVGGGMVPNISGLKRTSIARRALKVLDEVILALRDMHQPVIAAVNGAAIGGGFCLAVAADIRIGSDAAYFRAAGINNGLTANELGISYLLPRQIGFSRAFDILLSGRDVDAEEAERIGLVSQMVPGDQLLERCYELADGDHRLQPRRRGAHQAVAVGEPRRREPALAHEPRGQRAALRAHDHQQLRREDRGMEGRAHARVHR